MMMKFEITKASAGGFILVLDDGCAARSTLIEVQDLIREHLFDAFGEKTAEGETIAQFPRIALSV